MEDGLPFVRGGKGDSQPFLLRLGLALALSLASYFASQLLSKPKFSSGDDGSKETSAKSSSIDDRGLEDELHILTNEEALAKVINGTSTTTIDTAKVVMNEFDGYPVENNVKTVEKGLDFVDREEMEKEIAYLRNLVEELKERERNLEIQMIEYYGLKEQEASLRELENRLKVNATEHKLLTLRIESLQVENQNLQAQVSNHPKLVAELESAREEIKLLKKKLKVDGEHAKEKLASLHQRIVEMLDRERKDGEGGAEVEKKVKEMEDEVMDLRKVNSRLAEENLKFVALLESMKVAASSHPNPHEVEALEVARNLREENENLKKDIEQLQTDRCMDAEELVYLRWVNACLRYELRNYQPPPGKTVARDLSNCLSPQSEKKAKKLILEYAKTGTNERNISPSLFDFDTESCSSSQTSNEEDGDASFVFSSSTKNSSSRKSKLISKLKKLVLGKDDKRNKIASIGNMNDRRNSSDSISSCICAENASANQLRCPRSSLDVQRMRKLDLEVKEGVAERCKSDLGTSHGHMSMISEDSFSDLDDNVGHDDAVSREKIKLKKFAGVLKGSVKPKRRITSFS